MVADSGQEKSQNRFEDFFHDPLYLEFKNHLYNYVQRKKAICRELADCEQGILLELGSGISPIVDSGPDVVYSDVSVDAMLFLKQHNPIHHTLVMNAACIPFQGESIATILCSEVLEHVENDTQVLAEIHRVLKPGGRLILTVPAHTRYYAYDDRFVKHWRRYDLRDLYRRLMELGFRIVRHEKTAGFLDKIAMIIAAVLFPVVSSFKDRNFTKTNRFLLSLLLPVYKAANWLYGKLVQWEAKIIPLSMASIVLLHVQKKSPRRRSAP